MAPVLTVVSITPELPNHRYDLIDRAWPVAQLLEPGISLESWRDTVLNPGGLCCVGATTSALPVSHMLVLCERGYIRSMARYACGPADNGHPALFVDAAVTSPGLGSDMPADVLLKGLLEEAMAVRCVAFHARAHASSIWVIVNLAKGDYSAVRAAFVRCLGTGESRP
jgi:hypothetical protein